MTTTAPEALDLQRAARDHLWLHFTRMGGYQDAEVPIIVRGDGCYLEDAHGKRYLDALAGLFSVNIGYGYGEEMGEAAAAQMRELPFYTNWSYAHPRAIELASRDCLAGARRPEQALLRVRRLRSRGVGLEAGAPVLRGTRRDALSRRACTRAACRGGRRLRRDGGSSTELAAAVEGHLASHRVSRDNNGCTLDQRDPRDP